MSNSKTIICDIDGCISEHNGDICRIHQGPLKLLPGVLETFKRWDQHGNNIIILTGRREGIRKDTEKQLADAGIFYDQLVMGVKNFTRVLINDRKPSSNENTAIAINLERNVGMSDMKI